MSIMCKMKSKNSLNIKNSLAKIMIQNKKKLKNKTYSLNNKRVVNKIAIIMMILLNLILIIGKTRNIRNILRSKIKNSTNSSK